MNVIGRKLGQTCIDLTQQTTFHCQMPPRKFKESDGIVQWVNTSKSEKPRFKLREQILESQPSKSDQTPGDAQTTGLQPPLIKEPDPSDMTADLIQPSDEQIQDGFNLPSLEFPSKKRKSQRDYMKEWRDEKRDIYLERILSGYEKRQEESTRCPVCYLGQAVWRCRDCSDRRIFCVLCFRDRHSSDLFHRVEKWNGRCFSRGSLWQCGVKIHLGHQGSPCPLSSSGLNLCNTGGSNTKGTNLSRGFSMISVMKDLEGLSKRFSTTAKEMLMDISEALQKPELQWGDTIRGYILAIEHNLGKTIVEDIIKWKQVLMQAEKDEADLQAKADKENAEHETLRPKATCEDPLLTQIPIPEDGNDEWEDEDDTPVPGNIPRFIPRPPTKDGSGNDFLTIIHPNGFHSLPVVWCNCHDHLHDREMHLLDLRLYPATYENIKTVITFQCLEDYRLENLECKTSHYQYHQKLKRLTCPEYPPCAPNRYNELRRLTRQWRNLKYRKWFFVMGNRKMERGSMALFCAACPQPGINLPPDWEQDYAANPSCYMRSYVADGNFKADHLKQKNDDVWLTDGESFMTNRERYASHLELAQETRVKGTCNRHRAQLNGEASHNTSDCSGVGGHCCARHGCFAPGSLVDFQKGERQMNMDWSLCEALATTTLGPIKEVMHIYDINCQYCVHLRTRIERNPHLKIPDNTVLRHAIGLFHVHGHKDDCLYRWATTYIPGAGMIDGEILETLWAVLNSVSRSMRTASLPHRTEILDDHMNDSNFKKMTNIVKSVITRYNRALENVIESEIMFNRLNEVIPSGTTAQWTDDIQEAESKRDLSPESMDIMHSRVAVGESIKEVTTQLMREDGLSLSNKPDDGTATNWLLEGLNIEEEQIRVRQEVRRMPSAIPLDQRHNLEHMRQRLAAKVRDFHTASGRLLGIQVVASRLGRVDEMPPDGYVSDELREENIKRVPNESEIENTALVFPSSIAGRSSDLMTDLRRRECRLRRAKANEALARLRETLSGLSYQYINKIRQAKTSKEHLNSYKGIKLLVAEVSFYQQVYNRNRSPLIRLDPSLSSKYPYLRRDECRISTALADVNSESQNQAKLSWFWGALDGYEKDTAQDNVGNPAMLMEMYRVNWLRARAKMNRWKEELPRTRHEMTWTTLYFLHQRHLWYDRSRADPMHANSMVFKAYCEKKNYYWEEMARIADFQFSEADSDYRNIWVPLVHT